MNSDPTWTCSVDGSDIIVENPPPSQSTENNLLLCSAQDLPDASHNLTVTVSAGPQHNFFFDYLRYTPSNSEDFDDALVFVPFGDPDIIYQGNWDPFDNATITSTEGSSATIKFTGICQILYISYAQRLMLTNDHKASAHSGMGYYPLRCQHLAHKHRIQLTVGLTILSSSMGPRKDNKLNNLMRGSSRHQSSRSVPTTLL